MQIVRPRSSTAGPERTHRVPGCWGRNNRRVSMLERGAAITSSPAAIAIERAKPWLELVNVGQECSVSCDHCNRSPFSFSRNPKMTCLMAGDGGILQPLRREDRVEKGSRFTDSQCHRHIRERRGFALSGVAIGKCWCSTPHSS